MGGIVCVLCLSFCTNALLCGTIPTCLHFRYGNPTGGEDNLESFVAAVKTVSSERIGSLSFIQNGLYEVALLATETGTNNQVLVYFQGECVLSNSNGNAVTVETVPDVVSADDSHYTCQAEIVAGAPVNCELSAFDQYGNPAGSSDDIEQVGKDRGKR